MKYLDLVYFGYEFDNESREFEIQFKKEIKENFHDVELKDAFDSIKGYRQEVYLPETELEENYWSWLLAFGWFSFSLVGQLMMMSKETAEELNKYIDLAKKKYPEKFKPE